MGFIKKSMIIQWDISKKEHDNTMGCRRLDTMWVSISRFALDELDSVQFHHDITCLESDSIVVSFTSGTGFLRVNVVQFWFQQITCHFLPSCIVVFIDKVRTRNDE